MSPRTHRLLLLGFLAVLAGHWAEHLVQGFQVFVLHWPRPQAQGILGLWFPWLVQTESLHFWHAIFTYVMLWVLAGPYGVWWTVALCVQGFHLLEHALLFAQAARGVPLVDRVSVLSVFLPRVELHLFYNTVVLVPMVIAMWRRR